MTNRLLDLFRSGLAKRDRLLLPVEKVGASRGIYQGKEFPPTVQFMIDTEAGDKITLEMTVAQTREAIEALTHTYYAINPPLSTRNYGGFTS